MPTTVRASLTVSTNGPEDVIRQPGVGAATSGLATRTILVASADRSLGRIVRRSLGDSEVKVVVTSDADRTIADLGDNGPSLVLADYEMTESRLAEILAHASANAVPVIVVCSDQDEVLQSLELGAGDFVMKPVSPRELALRVALHGLAGSRFARVTFISDGLSIDRSARRVLRDGETIDLTPLEYQLLEFLATRPGVTFTREELLATVWASSSEWQGTATVTEHVHRLRRELERDPSRPRWIITVHGKGYRFQP